MTDKTQQEGSPSDRFADLLVRAVADLGPWAIILLVAAIYTCVAIALPLVIGGSRLQLIALGALGAGWAWALTLAWAWAQRVRTDRRHLLEWTTDLRHLDAQEFEWLVGEIFRREGWEVEETGGHGVPDGNVDLRISRNGNRRLVQCKRWESWVVPVKEIRELGGTLARENLSGECGILVTLSDFSPQAAEEAAAIGIELIDGRSLLTRIEKVRKGEPCPTCGSPMILDRSRHGWWLRCPTYPDCNGKRNLGSEPARAVELLVEPQPAR